MDEKYIIIYVAYLNTMVIHRIEKYTNFYVGIVDILYLLKCIIWNTTNLSSVISLAELSVKAD